MMRNDVSIPCGTLTLEGVLEIPTNGGRRVPGAVICHPHPLYGGNMHNNVVRAIRKGLLDRGVACLRFNFRGTGRSWGDHGDGTDEIQDVLAALDFLQQAPAVAPQKLLVAGYSFGCWVGLKAAAKDARPISLIGVSPPVDVYDFTFLLEEKRPKLLIAGDRDFVCAADLFQKLTAQVPDPKRVVLLAGADHFHVGNEEKLIREVDAFIDAYPL
jgi:uncharacterized protein